MYNLDHNGGPLAQALWSFRLSLRETRGPSLKSYCFLSMRALSTFWCEESPEHTKGAWPCISQDLRRSVPMARPTPLLGLPCQRGGVPVNMHTTYRFEARDGVKRFFQRRASTEKYIFHVLLLIRLYRRPGICIKVYFNIFFLLNLHV